MSDTYSNEAAIYFSENKLVVNFGEDRTAVMDLENDQERELVRTILADANLWDNFLGALSASLTQHK